MDTIVVEPTYYTPTAAMTSLQVIAAVVFVKYNASLPFQPK